MSRIAASSSRLGMTPWPDDHAARYVANGYWENRGLADHLADAEVSDDSIRLVDGRMRMNHRDLRARVDGAACRLRELGLEPDDRVVVQLPNCWEFAVLTMACFRIGVIPVMALPAHRHLEISGLAGLVEAKALVVPGASTGFDHQEMARDIVASTPGVDLVLVAGGDVKRGNVDLGALCEPPDRTDGVAEKLDKLAPNPDAIALFLLSGGTTGRPKLIPRTHNDYAYMVKRAAAICGCGPDTVYLAAHPVAHGFTMAGPGVLGTLISGGRVVMSRSPEPARAFATIEREKVTMTSLVPTSVARWLQHREEDRKTDLGSLRLIQVGGARFSPEMARKVPQTFGCSLQQAYGMSEGLYCLTRLDDSEEVICRTQGRPICPDDEILLVDDHDEPVALGEQGVLLTRGPYTPRGYYRAPDLNTEAFNRDGWYRTGDVVRLRPDGNVVIEGRTKDVINRGGEKISAKEVEEVAERLDGITRAAAVGIPDTSLGERICLYVVPTPGYDVSLDWIRMSLNAAGMAAYKIPERLVVVDDLPVTAVGKIDKNALRAQFVVQPAT